MSFAQAILTRRSLAALENPRFAYTIILYYAPERLDSRANGSFVNDGHKLTQLRNVEVPEAEKLRKGSADLGTKRASKRLPKLFATVLS